MGTYSFIFFIKAEGVYIDIAVDSEIERPLSMGKKVIVLMKSNCINERLIILINYGWFCRICTKSIFL